MSGFDITPGSLDASGQHLVAVASRFAAALTAFQAEIGAFGRPWGEDDIGSLIGAAHDEVSTYAYECYQDALDEIAAAGIDLSGMAAAYTAADQAADERFRGIGGQL